MIGPIDLSRLEQRLRDYIDQRLANAIEYTQYTRSSALGAGDKTKGHQTEGGEREYDHDAQRMQSFGLRSVPPKGTWCVRVATGGGNMNGVIIGEDPGDRYGPQDLEDGEAALYNKQTGCVIKLDKNGKITIDAKSGQIVAANGEDWTAPQWEQFLVALKAFLTALNGATDAAVQTAAANFTTALSTGNTGAAAVDFKSAKLKWG